ncbi:EamA family transporter [Pseudooceanicola sp. C21-150M6]|uniref:EamA family transporter n=1 Tax=Pseudooceanicola sp. C21-150M6 TaxID=3434355 RepID=UPI003D7F26C3
MTSSVQPQGSRPADHLPPHLWFGISAVFHYLGPAFAVLLFPEVGVLGVAWFRIASAALVFAPLTRPWTVFARMRGAERRLVIALGLVLAVMNSSFYLALDRLPMALVAALEFLGTILLAAWGLRSPRNGLALVLAIGGVALLLGLGSLRTGAAVALNDPVGLAWAALNGGLFVLYVVLGHRLSRGGAVDGVARLGAAMSVAFVVVCPIGLVQAARAFDQPLLILAGIGVGICSSVIPYVCDQLAMARLPRATFALMLALLPAMAAVIGALVLRQTPTWQEGLGVVLVMAGVAVHRPARE